MKRKFTNKIILKTVFKRTQEVFKLRQEEKTISMQIDGTEATIRSMNSKIHQYVYIHVCIKFRTTLLI